MAARVPSYLVVPLVFACAGESASRDDEPAPGPAAATAAESFVGRHYERNLVFLTPRSDSVVTVSWLVTARTVPGGVQREVQGWLGRGGSFEPFLLDVWETPPDPTPWRMLPRDMLRVVVGQGDALQRLVFDDGLRHLEFVLENQLVTWSGQRGENLTLLTGGLILSSTRVSGLMLDMARAWRTNGPQAGDWTLLASGDSLQIVMHAPTTAPQSFASPFRAWARLDFRTLNWPRLSVEWPETRSFEPARRDVPVAMSVSSPDADLTIELTVSAAQIEALPGDGPQLPVQAIFEVVGTAEIEGSSYPVVGLFRHLQR